MSELRPWFVVTKEAIRRGWDDPDPPEHDVVEVCARTKRDALIAGIREMRRIGVDLDWSASPFAQVRAELAACDHGEWRRPCVQCDADDAVEYALSCPKCHEPGTEPDVLCGLCSSPMWATYTPDDLASGIDMPWDVRRSLECGAIVVRVMR